MQSQFTSFCGIPESVRHVFFLVVTYGDSTQQANRTDDTIADTSRYMFTCKLCYTSQTPTQETEFVAGPTEGTSVDDSNEGIIPVADVVDIMYPRSPGIRLNFILFM